MYFPKLEQYLHDPFNISRLFGILLIIKHFVVTYAGRFMDHGLDSGTIYHETVCSKKKNVFFFMGKNK